MDKWITIAISIVSSSLMSLILNSLFFIPVQEKRKYMFDEKKILYDSLSVFCQIVLFPDEARYSLGVAKYDIQKLSNEENVQNAINDLKMSLPKIKLISNDAKIEILVKKFISAPTEKIFYTLLERLRKDLYR